MSHNREKEGERAILKINGESCTKNRKREGESISKNRKRGRARAVVRIEREGESISENRKREREL